MIPKAITIIEAFEAFVYTVTTLINIQTHITDLLADANSK
jgi:hypothetical protein